MTFSPVPKNTGRLDADEKMAARVQRIIDRRKHRKPLKRSALPRNRKPIKQRNEKRIAKKAASYRKVIASDFHKRLRYAAYLRSGGACECTQCVAIRAGRTRLVGDAEDVQGAYGRIPVWFTKSGAEPHKRFRSDAGEIHHMSYKFFGDENLDELALVRWVWKSCHQRIESEHGTRRRFLKGAK